MMSRRRVCASIASVSLATTACVASSGASSSSWFAQTQTTGTIGASGGTESAAAVTEGGGNAFQQGPRVSLYAEVATYGGSRRVRANFHLEDDAYVLVGHIDADGILRIEFPDNPLDGGLVRGHASYQTAEFFAGFANEYRARFNTGYSLSGASRTDSYDGGLGYVFAIASWQPMHFDRFSTKGVWDSFEVSDADYLRDPRPAVYELAALLAGQNPEAYTVQFARVYDTRSVYTGADSFFGDSFGAQLCSGLNYGFSVGFASSPFGFGLANPLFTYGYGNSFWYRGSLYSYSQAGDCYYRSNAYRPYGYGYYGWSIAQTPVRPPQPGAGRFITTGKIRPPVSPQVTPMQIAPGGAQDAGATNVSPMKLAPDAPQYRTRGLVAHQDPTGGEILAPRSLGNDRRARDASTERPGIQGMVIRGGNSDDGVVRGQNRDDASARRVPTARTESPAASTPRTESPRVDAPRAVPQARTESPRVEAPRIERSAPPPPARVEPPRTESPRSEPARTPPPASSSSSSSSGKPPGKN
jgi:hypothetical protein